MTTPQKPSYSYRMASHIFNTFHGLNDVLTPEQRAQANAQSILDDNPWQSGAVKAEGTDRDGNSIRQHLKRSPTGSFVLQTISLPSHNSVETHIPRYGNDPMEKVADSLFIRELARIANEATVQAAN